MIFLIEGRFWNTVILLSEPAAGYTLELDFPILVKVEAKLAEVQHAEQEDYVPFIVQSVARV